VRCEERRAWRRDSVNVSGSGPLGRWRNDVGVLAFSGSRHLLCGAETVSVAGRL
jgi:hypothetical protein